MSVGLANAAGSAPAWDSNTYSWNGFYAGVVAGGAWGQYNPRTSTIGDGYMDATQAAAVSAAGTQTINASGFVAGVEGGYNWRSGNWLFGLEADVQAVHLNGATNSGAVQYPGAAPGLAFTVTSYGNTDWLFTARPRIGFIAANNWLFYATGGLALAEPRTDFSFVDDNGAAEAGKANVLQAGYAVGVGVEAPLSGSLSIKADYLHVAFPNTAGVSTTNDLLPFFPGQVFTHASEFKADLFRAGLNYRFGGPDPTPAGTSSLFLQARPVNAFWPNFSEWDVETGTRLWLSTGSYGAPQPLIDTPPPTLASRLTYSGLDALSGETFARADHVSGFFVKGYLGAGGIYKGAFNDEDFPAGNAYSNTLSSASGHIGYATVDVGYNFLKVPGAKVGAFVGYNYYDQAINVYGCTQLTASNGSCPPAPGLPASLLGLTDDNQFNSLRVGFSMTAMVTDRLRLTADAAYVPLANFSGLDNHLLRQLLLPEAANDGDGVMLEAMLDYYVTPNWSIGVGGRYWAWNMNTGSITFNFLAPPGTFPETGRYNAERYGAFVETSYRWGEPTLTAAASSASTQTLAGLAPGPMDWTGLYVGAHLGGGVSDASWSDPFGSTIGVGGGLNVAGFGDSTHAQGGLGGGQIGANWQAGRWILGVEADASAAAMRGENTCFSGLGGIDCQHAINALGTITGRVGYAWDRSLLYIKGGGAWTDTTYNLNGDTFALTLGTGSATFLAWGWIVGGGIEYALTNHWTAFAEYDHIGLPAMSVPFPTVAVINANTIAVSQSVDLFKLGVNYKFDFGPLTAVAAAH